MTRTRTKAVVRWLTPVCHGAIESAGTQTDPIEHRHNLLAERGR